MREWDEQDEREADLAEVRLDALRDLSPEEREETLSARAVRSRNQRLAQERRHAAPFRPGARDNHDREGYEW